LLIEIKNNFSAFQSDWQSDLAARMADLPNHVGHFEKSYVRLTSLQAWRLDVVEQYLTPGSIGFYSEAQNDALISHVQASLGSWRVALKALRSCLENMLMCLYYKDHEVELILWGQGSFRISVSEAIKYFQKHPFIAGVPDALTGLGLVNKEYKQLSEAVHASSVDFRMTEDGKAPSLWKTDNKHESIWSTHERNTLQGINLLLLVLFREHLQGTKAGPLRQSLAFVIPKSKDSEIKKELRVTIKR
jgi:hypothetical protein